MFVQLKPLFIALGVIFLFSMNSCTKFGKNITVKGRVLNPVTGEGIEGIDVWLQKDSWGIPGGFKNVKETTTDANGYYEINAASLSMRYLRVSTPSEYYDIGWDSDAGGSSTGQLYIETGKTTWANYRIVTFGQLKVNIHNVNCEGPTDSLILERNYLTQTAHDVYQPVTIPGCYNQDGIPAEVPMGYYEIKWTVIRTGGTNVYTDTILVPETGVAEYTINY